MFGKKKGIEEDWQDGGGRGWTRRGIKGEGRRTLTNSDVERCQILYRGSIQSWRRFAVLMLLFSLGIELWTRHSRNDVYLRTLYVGLYGLLCVWMCVWVCVWVCVHMEACGRRSRAGWQGEERVERGETVPYQAGGGGWAMQATGRIHARLLFTSTTDVEVRPLLNDWPGVFVSVSECVCVWDRERMGVCSRGR